jgi:hypothetical protein
VSELALECGKDAPGGPAEEPKSSAPKVRKDHVDGIRLPLEVNEPRGGELPVVILVAWRVTLIRRPSSERLISRASVRSSRILYWENEIPRSSSD